MADLASQPMPPSAPLPKVYIHPPSTLSTILDALAPCLPHALPLYRRIQHPDKSEHARIFATFPPTQNGTNGTNGVDISNEHHSKDNDIPQCFAAAFIDREARPATEMLIFLSGEVEGRCNCASQWGVQATGDIINSTHSNSTLSNSHDQTLSNTYSPGSPQTPCSLALLSLLHSLLTLPFPQHTPSHLTDIHRAAHLVAERLARNPSTALKSHYPPHETFLTDIHEPRYLKLGAAAALPVTMLARWGVLKGAVGRETAHGMFTFRLDGEGEGSVPRDRVLGKGLRWGEVREEDLDLVRMRTPIPRTHRGLRKAKGIAVFPVGEGEGEAVKERNGIVNGEKGPVPIAWAFVGTDGGLASLHVEPEWRGRGIAKTLAAKMFLEFPTEDGWALAFVGVGNRESEAVCKGVGGVVRTWVWWVRVDLDAVRGLEK